MHPLIQKSAALRLMRVDKPIGTWLTLWPGFWALALAGATPITHPIFYILFAIGAFLVRSAGCILNDLADKDFDSSVARTKTRPLASGEISVKSALRLLILLLIAAMTILLYFNKLTIFLGMVAIIPVAIYPYMKRFTYWPQVFLGLTINWGALMGGTAVLGSITLPHILLYISCIFWTLAYDTVYAHQDKEDDVLVGIKSSALKLGKKTKPALLLFFIVQCLFLAAALYDGPTFKWVEGIPLAGICMTYLYLIFRVDLSNPASCLTYFKHQTLFGVALWALTSLRIYI